jgi:hypothetical protein
MAEGRRFPAPWRAEKIAGGYVVRDANGQALAYLYSRENEAEARQAKVLTADEARRIATNLARLPELLRQAGRAAEAERASVARLRRRSVLDDCTRDCLALVADTSIFGIHVSNAILQWADDHNRANRCRMPS